jgi:hypothetical protein
VKKPAQNHMIYSRSLFSLLNQRCLVGCMRNHGLLGSNRRSSYVTSLNLKRLDQVTK